MVAVAQTASPAGSTTRTPNRCASQPATGCSGAYDQKNADSRTPTWEFVRPSSSFRSGPAVARPAVHQVNERRRREEQHDLH